MTELLAPAGNLERLKWAVAYGADAVYFGVGNFSLRSFAGNFSLEDAQTGLDYLHERGKRGYVTLNAYPFTEEFEEIAQLAASLDEMGADAFIVADLGVLNTLRGMGLRAALHISTQANTLNAQSALAYQKLGARRVNLARELSLTNIQDIQKALQGTGMETEVFIHGSVCFSYSGRCAISDYTTGRRANRGQCTHPCRWNYTLMEEKRPGEYFPVYEDERGLYLFNSKDLALFNYVPALVEAGVCSFKIEGRMKNAHYLAAVLPVYRAILDGKPMPVDEAWLRLMRVDNRGFSDGFMKGELSSEDYETHSTVYQSSSRWMANSTEQMQDGQRVCQIKNTIDAGETLELLTPDGGRRPYTLPNLIFSVEGKPLDRAKNQHTILLDGSIPAYSIFRRVLDQSDNAGDVS